MQPENSRQTTPGVEQLPMPPTIGAEMVPNLPPVVTSVERGQQQVEQAAESGARVMDATAQATAVAATGAPVVATPPADQQPTPSGVAPLVAADEDVIEKEWVDKAKEIIDQTKDDPHARTQKVNELQRDYLNKRYGKVVGASE